MSKKRTSGELLLICFDGSEALVEGERLLNEFEPLYNILVADATCFFDKVQAFTYDGKLCAQFPQLWCMEVLQNLPGFVHNAHGKHRTYFEVYSQSDVEDKK